jgi:hypothetical protein
MAQPNLTMLEGYYRQGPGNPREMISPQSEAEIGPESIENQNGAMAANDDGQNNSIKPQVYM